jgi:hypothetical protein
MADGIAETEKSSPSLHMAIITFPSPIAMMKLLIPLFLVYTCMVAQRVSAADADGKVHVCRGDEITVDFAPANASRRPRIYEIDRTLGPFPKSLTLNRRTGILNGIVRDSGFRNVYNLGVIITDPVSQDTTHQTVEITVDWCQGSRVSRFWVVDTDTNMPIRVLRNGDVVNLAHLGGFSVDVETYAEIATEAQSEGDLTDKVTFKLNGETIRTEEYWPYSLGGDKDGNYFPFPITVGEHRLEAIPFNSSGEIGVSKEILFTVIDGESQESST